MIGTHFISSFQFALVVSICAGAPACNKSGSGRQSGEAGEVRIVKEHFGGPRSKLTATSTLRDSRADSSGLSCVVEVKSSQPKDVFGAYISGFSTSTLGGALDNPLDIDLMDASDKKLGTISIETIARISQFDGDEGLILEYNGASDLKIPADQIHSVQFRCHFKPELVRQLEQ